MYRRGSGRATRKLPADGGADLAGGWDGDVAVDDGDAAGGGGGGGWLHGDGGTGNGFGAGFYPYTDPDGAILVTPNGTDETWTHAADDLPGQPQDSQFLSLIVDSLIAQGVAGERVDPDRIYVGGESRGAFMPYFLLQRPSTKYRFAAVAVNAGLLYCQDGDDD